MFKVNMRLMDALKDIMSFIVIYYSLG